MRAIGAVLVLAIAPGSACSPERVQAPPGYQAPDPKLCKAEGGRIQRTLLPSVHVCVRPYADAGKACIDGSECAGSCLITEIDTDWNSGLRAGQDASGHCQAEEPFLGCYVVVEQGKTKQAICAD